MTNKIWIELDRGVNDHDIQAELGTKVLHKLGFQEHVAFWWNDAKRLYCLTINGSGEFLELTDYGHWFNLDFAGK